MPLDVTETDGENGSQSSTRNTASPSAEPHPSRITGVREILQRAREARLMNERMTETSNSARADNRPRRIRGPIPMPLLRSSSAIMDTPNSQLTAVLNGGRRESPRESVYNESISTTYQLARVQSTSQIQSQRQIPNSPSLSSTSLLRRELDSDDIPSRLSILRANALLMHDDLERAMDELGLPFIQTRRDSIPPRNHHRHSSMSTSPRVLESGSSPATSTRHNEPDLNDKLEDVLFFLDMQRLPSTDLGKLIHFSHFQRSLVAECSWLRPGGRFHGIQSFARDTNSLISNLTRRRQDSQSVPSKEWKVEVVIDQVDYSDMSIAGSMTAYDMPESGDRPSVTTFWTGEVNNLISLFVYYAYFF